MIGTLNALLYSQLPTEILQEHHLKGHTQDYPLIVIPEWKKINKELQNELIEYVQQGGNLLVIGPETVKLFENQLGVKLSTTTKPISNWGFNNLLTYIKPPCAHLNLWPIHKLLEPGFREVMFVMPKDLSPL